MLYPKIFDFTHPRLGYSFQPMKDEGKFADRFNMVSAIIYIDSASYIEEGDVAIWKAKNGKLVVFKLKDVKGDSHVDNVFTCKAVFCGYKDGNVLRYFDGFKEAWEKNFNITSINISRDTSLNWIDVAIVILISAVTIFLLLLIINSVIGA